MNSLQESIREKIKSMKCMEDFLMIYRLHKIPEYKKWCNDFFGNTYFKFQEFGPLNKQRLIYVQEITDPASGFFWCWRQACNSIMVADRYGFTPVIDWRNSPFYEPDGFSGIDNPFEYYFKPVSDISLADVLQSYNVAYYNAYNSGIPSIPYERFTDNDILLTYANINEKYFHIREDVFNDIKSQIDTIFCKKKTIGVHVRGVEWGKIKGHPIPPSFITYAEKVDEAIKEYDFEQIFLATDSEDTVTFFRHRYGDRVKYYGETVRSKKGNRTLVIFDNNIKRAHNRYWLGYEVLRDMLTLSFCDGLVAGMSNVSFAAEVFKLSRGETYMYKYMVEQTVRRKGMSSLKAMRLMKENKF